MLTRSMTRKRRLQGADTSGSPTTAHPTSVITSVAAQSRNTTPSHKTQILKRTAAPTLESSSESAKVAEITDPTLGVARVLEPKYEERQESKNVVQLSGSIWMFCDKKLSKHGEVYEGVQRHGNFASLPVAIKLVEHNAQSIAEAKILAKLNNHSHVIALIETGFFNNGFEDQVYIVLDKCKENLREFMTSRKTDGIPFDLNCAMNIANQLIVGVEYIHSQNIIHMDLKPDNILFTLDQKTIKIADFGLSEEIESKSKSIFRKGPFGTDGFRAAESFGKSVVSQKSDVFSLGVIFYYILSDGQHPFGDDFAIWNYNMKKCIIDLSRLLVSNPKTFDHLIRSMIEYKLNDRPTIWQVSQHPCWTGKEIECNFDYHTPESLQVTVPSPNEQTPQLTITTDGRQQLLKLLEDCRRRAEAWIARITRIVIFDLVSGHLQLYNPFDNTLKQVQSMNEDMKEYPNFSVVTLDDHIYVLMRRKSVYRLKYSDETATWERMADMIDNHGLCPPATVMSGCLYIVGGSYGYTSGAMEKYEPPSNKWISLERKQLETNSSAIIATKGFIYSIGGWSGNGYFRDVERFDPISSTWKFVSPMQKARQFAAAVEFDSKIFVLGGFVHGKKSTSSEVFDPSANVWSLMKTEMLKPRERFNAFEINGKIYAVGGDDKNESMERYNTDEDSWEEVQLPRKLRIFPHGFAKVKI